MLDSAIEDVRLPRVTTFGAVPNAVAGGDFYRKASPFMRRVNAALEKVILASIVLSLAFITWLAFGAELEDAYVSDGVRSCRVAPLSQAEAAQVQAQDVSSASASPSAK